MDFIIVAIIGILFSSGLIFKSLQLTKIIIPEENSPITPKKNHRVEYRDNGDIDWDPDSRMPSFVQYNNAREEIRQSKANGNRFSLIQLSTACEKELREDGYSIEYRKNWDQYDIVRW